MAVVAEPPPAQPEGPHHPKGDQPARRALASQTPHYSSLARTALRRHQPEVGAGCPNGARPVLCGGCAVMGIPTATRTQDRAAALHLDSLTDAERRSECIGSVFRCRPCT